MNVDSGLRKQGGPAHEEVEIDASVKAGDYSHFELSFSLEN